MAASPKASSRRIVRTKTSSAVADCVLAGLFEGRLKFGDRVDFDELCEVLGVSRIPVREAMVMLERDGIVATKYHRGVYVEPFDAEPILDEHLPPDTPTLSAAERAEQLAVRREGAQLRRIW